MDESPNREQRPLKGLYGKVKVSVHTLDKVIIGGIIAIALVLALGVSKRGFTVNFDSMGGTAVESRKCMYGDLVEPPEDPTREGYTFAGWYRDKNCTYPWDMAADKVESSMDLYAGWESK